jgi:phospholipid/cholesterol/gamma-HCH transport system substrate-binding protein
MIKDTPSVGRIAAMAIFTLSCFGLLIWLWLSFGGPVPLNPQGYRVKASFAEAALLVEQADVRIAGLNVGKVVDKEADYKNGRTIATLELEEQYAPIPRDTRAILRQKALLGETYVELSAGSPTGPKLGDEELLPRRAEQESVQVDEIVRTFDRPTRRAFQSWIRELARAIEKGRGEDLNDALGNLPEFVASGKDVLEVLDEEEPALRGVIRNSARALGAVNQRYGQLRELVVNADNTFGAFASQNEALAEAVFILPTFLDESKATFRRLKRFARDTRPLVRDLQPVATDLAPTLRDVGRLAPDLRRLFRNLDPLIDESERNLPAAARFLRGAEPVLEALHTYLPELNPILSFLNYEQAQVADFIMNGSTSSGDALPPFPGEGPRHYLRSYSATNSRSLGLNRTRPSYERGNAYPAPNYGARLRALGIAESFDCKPPRPAPAPTNVPGGKRVDPADGQPPCFVQPQSLFDGRYFPRLGRGEAPVRDRPSGNVGTRPAEPR